MSAKHKVSKSRDGKAVIVIGPYDEGLVAALKSRIPSRARQWRPVAKCWRVDVAYEEQVRSLVEDFGREVME